MARSRRTAEFLVVGLLNSLLADAEARQAHELTVGLGLGHVLFRHGGDIAHDMRKLFPVRIVARFADIGNNAREIGLVDVDLGELIPG